MTDGYGSGDSFDPRDEYYDKEVEVEENYIDDDIRMAIAANDNNFYRVEELLEKGVYPDERALEFAVVNNNAAIVELLLGHSVFVRNIDIDLIRKLYATSSGTVKQILKDLLEFREEF